MSSREIDSEQAIQWVMNQWVKWVKIGYSGHRTVTYDRLLFLHIQYFATFIICFVARKDIQQIQF